MKSLIRSLVAAPKHSHYDVNLEKEFDLMYITDQLIVAAAPVNSLVKSFYRNDVRDIVKFLDSNHNLNNADWHIWNLRGEEPGYYSTDVRGKVSYYPFPDHQAPTLDILIEAVNEIHNFLSLNPKNVAFLHCKAGKGRSGTLCCAYLMKIWCLEGKPFNPEIANEYFTERRMKVYSGHGISILSQKRYLSYWYDYLSFDQGEKNLFNNIRFKNIYHSISINSIEIQDFLYDNNCRDSEVVNLKIKIEGYKVRRDNPNGVSIISLQNILDGFECVKTQDKLIIKLFDPILIPDGISDIRISVKGWCYFWFNVYMNLMNELETKNDLREKLKENLTSETILIKRSINWEEFDGIKGFSHKGMKKFSKINILSEIYFPGSS